MQTIHDHYNADIWIVSYDDGRLIYQFLDSGGNIVDPRYISSEAVLAQIASVYQGNEIRVQGLFPELGENIVTIGVPWRYSDGHVVGAVLLNISTEDLRVRFMDVLPSLLPVGAGVLILGVFCSLLLARSLTRPLKEITCLLYTSVDERICVVEADLMGSSSTGRFQKLFPERTIDVGVAEANMIGVAAVSYTHLDVYKRQAPYRAINFSIRFACENYLNFTKRPGRRRGSCHTTLPPAARPCAFPRRIPARARAIPPAKALRKRRPMRRSACLLYTSRCV